MQNTKGSSGGPTNIWGAMLKKSLENEKWISNHSKRQETTTEQMYLDYLCILSSEHQSSNPYTCFNKIYFVFINCLWKCLNCNINTVELLWFLSFWYQLIYFSSMNVMIYFISYISLVSYLDQYTDTNICLHILSCITWSGYLSFSSINW